MPIKTLCVALGKLLKYQITIYCYDKIFIKEYCYLLLQQFEKVQRPKTRASLIFTRVRLLQQCNYLMR